MVGAFTGAQRADLWRVLQESSSDAEQDMEQVATEQVKFEQMTAKQKADRLQSDREQLQRLLRPRPAQEWEQLLNAAGVPAARVRSVDETLSHAQVDSRQVLQAAQGLPEEYAELKMPMAAFSYAHNGPAIQQHAAAHGQHTREILRESGYDDQRIFELERTGVVLQAE